MGQAGELTVQQLGLLALFKRSVGDRIAKYVNKALPTEDEQRAFARLMMDQYSKSVLAELKDTYDSALTIVEFSGQLTSDSDWNDEMHPTEAAFKRLAIKLREAVRAALPEEKRATFG